MVKHEPIPPGVRSGGSLNAGQTVVGDFQMASPANPLAYAAGNSAYRFPAPGSDWIARGAWTLKSLYIPVLVVPVTQSASPLPPFPTEAYVGLFLSYGQTTFWNYHLTVPLTVAPNGINGGGNGVVNADLVNPIEIPPGEWLAPTFSLAFDQSVIDWEIGLGALVTDVTAQIARSQPGVMMIDTAE